MLRGSWWFNVKNMNRRLVVRNKMALKGSGTNRRCGLGVSVVLLEKPVTIKVGLVVSCMLKSCSVR